jgi:hypothetical protein
MTDPRMPFTATLRARQETIELAPVGTPGAITFRVEMPEIWDVVRMTALPGEPVISAKVRALEALMPQADFHEDFMLKLRGWEVLDENASLADAGMIDGSILLLTHRRRRPVR